MNNKDVKKEFNETLAGLVEYAAVLGNHLTKETVHEYFGDLIQDENMYNFIYGYLTDAKITVEGYEPLPAPPADESDTSLRKSLSPQKKAEESEEARFFYDLYINEMNSVTSREEKEISALLDSLIHGNGDSAAPLAEHYLPLAVKLAEDFEDSGLSHSDLVAEGNLALYEAILAYPDFSEKAAVPEIFEKFLHSRIISSLRTAANAEIGSNRISGHLADQINALNDASTELAKELDREATLEELCERLSIGEDEIKELMKISINALSVIQTDED